MPTDPTARPVEPVGSGSRIGRREFHVGCTGTSASSGPQDVHMHPCECGVESQGPGRECDGDPKTHHRVKYNDRTGAWTRAR